MTSDASFDISGVTIENGVATLEGDDAELTHAASRRSSTR